MKKPRTSRPGLFYMRNTTNVIDFLGGKSNQPEPLRPSEVNRMLGAVDEMQEVGDEPAVVYHVGETVKVNYGPFNGFSGIIEEVNNEKKKLKVRPRQIQRRQFLNLMSWQMVSTLLILTLTAVCSM